MKPAQKFKLPPVRVQTKGKRGVIDLPSAEEYADRMKERVLVCTRVRQRAELAAQSVIERAMHDAKHRQSTR